MAKKRKKTARRSSKRRSAITCARLIPHLTKIVTKEAKKKGHKPDKAAMATVTGEMHAECAKASQELRMCLYRAKGVKSADTCFRKFDKPQPLSRRRRKGR
jgi:hypothetical protein